MDEAKIDYIDMSMRDSFKEPVEEEHQGRSLMSYFTELNRGDVRLGMAGKLYQSKDMLNCLQQGADFVLLGRAAILHHDYPNPLAANESFNSIATSKETTFTNELFKKAQLDGKTVVIHSWNKTCSTCAKQIKILDRAKQDFKDVIFLSFEQTKDKEIAKFLSIDYWTTIVVYRDNKEVSRTIGQTNKEKIYSQINSL